MVIKISHRFGGFNKTISRISKLLILLIGVFNQPQNLNLKIRVERHP